MLLGQLADVVDDMLFSKLEHFVCVLYSFGNTVDVNKVRSTLFQSRYSSLNSLKIIVAQKCKKFCS